MSSCTMTQFFSRSACWLLLLCCIATGRLAAQHPGGYCGNKSPEGDPALLLKGPPPNGSCGRQSALFNLFFKHKENFIPYTNNVTAPTVTKKIKVRFMIAEPYPGSPLKKNFRPGDEAQLQEMVTWLNCCFFDDTQVPTKPLTSICGSNCHIPNTRIQVELAGITYFNSQVYTSSTNLTPNIVDGDSVLNVFFCYSGEPSSVYWVGVANPSGGGISKFDFYANPGLTHIMMNNTYAGGDRWGASRVLMHEIFHEFGLWHLWDGSETCNEGDPDFLTDIFNTGSAKVCPQTGGFADCDPSSPTYYTVTCDNNVMASRGYNYASPMQLGIIHREAFMGRMARYTYPTEAPDVHPWVVTGSQTWDFPMRMYQDIIVKPYATLNITCELQMPAGSRIIVERGGRLIIDGGLITSYTPGTFWKGIEVMGDVNNISNPQYQGVLEMKNGATIERAHEGVWNFTSAPNSGGGIIQAYNSSFHNCWRAVVLNDYANYDYGNTNCRFENVQFLIDDMGSFPTLPAQQFGAWNIKGKVVINGCTFKIDIPQAVWPQQQRSEAFNAMGCGVRLTNNTFEGWKKGITVTGYTGSPTRNALIYGNYLKYITDNITLAADAYGDVGGNTITNMYNYREGRITRIASGIYLDNTRGSTVGCWNKVDGITDGLPGRTGIIANNTNSFGAVIRENEFTNLDFGSQMQMNNPELYLICNTYRSNRYPWLINPVSNTASMYLKDQGTGCTPATLRAGNKFIGTSATGADITTYLTNNWTYYAFSNDPDQRVNTFIGTATFNNCVLFGATTDPNSQCGIPRNCPVPLALKEGRTQLNSLKATGMSNSAEALETFGNVIRGYNDRNDVAGLQAFLEEEKTPNASKLLVPLYIERGQYAKALSILKSIPVPADEASGYQRYYNILIRHQQKKLPLNELTAEELATVKELAGKSLEVSAFAKALLEQAYGIVWEHVIEEMPQAQGQQHTTTAALVAPEASRLFEAVPNPSKGITTIHVSVSGAAVAREPVLIIRNTLGKEMYKKKLQSGETFETITTRTWAPGLYFYTLTEGGMAIATKKLIVVN